MQIDQRDDLLRRYLDDIRLTRPLGRVEEQTLFRLVAQGNSKAKQKLVAANMRFVLKVAIQYRGCPLALPDLVSEGAMGLVRAIESFDYSRGLKFISYAVWWIKAYITRAINEQGNLIRLPANQHLRIRKALRDQSRGMDLSEEIEALVQIGQGGVSFDSPLNDDARSCYADVLADEDAISADDQTEMDEIERMTQDLVRNLPMREASVISGIYGINQDAPMPLREVGDSLHISHERVRQLRDQALRRLRRMQDPDVLQEKFEAYLTARA